MILGAFLDCSRNAVFKVEEVKKYASYLSQLGYKELYLYTEDNYELLDEPYFGFLRAKYSVEELKELDDYCFHLGIELVPTVQVLGHMGMIHRWKRFHDIIDTEDILLVDEAKTYEFIEKVFLNVSRIFRSKRVNIGLDEAHNLGRGKYMDKHGYKKPYEILSKHLVKVSKIMEKYGLTGVMWSDLFFKFSNDGKYSCVGLNERKMRKAVGKIPKNIEVCYWRYYGNEKREYDEMFAAHKKFFKKVSFAGGAISWYGFTPFNDYSFHHGEVAIKSCIDNQIDRVVLTLWGDGGGQCSFYAMLPSVVAWSEFVKGNFNRESIKQRFQALVGEDYDTFMLLDLPNKIAVERVGANFLCNPSLYMLYNDYFCGAFDCFVTEGDGAVYGQYARQLAEHSANERFGYIFELLSKLCSVMQLKYDLGVKTRRLYQARDKQGLRKLIDEAYTPLVERLQAFQEAYDYRWEKENKTSGIEVEDIRVGGLIERTRHCAKLLERVIAEDFVICELEEKMLDFYGNGTQLSGNPIVCNQYLLCSSVNVFSHGLMC